jgi:hypothetical protein
MDRIFGEVDKVEAFAEQRRVQSVDDGIAKALGEKEKGDEVVQQEQKSSIP